MTDPMDERLRRAAVRWRADQAPAVSLPDRRLVRRRHPRARAWVVVGAAAATAAAVVVAVAITGDHDRRTVEGAPVSRPPARADGIRWKPLPATHPQIQTRVPHPSPGEAPYTTPFDALVVDGEPDLHGAPGDTVDFTITLSATTRTTLNPCPDYSMWVGTEPAQRFALNCAAVPYRDRHGVPYLPSGTPVDFRMRLTVPDLVGRQKVLWGIDGPFSIPGTNGVVTIEP